MLPYFATLVSIRVCPAKLGCLCRDEVRVMVLALCKLGEGGGQGEDLLLGEGQGEVVPDRSEHV